MQLYNEEQKRSYIAEYHMSGKNKTLFARENGIPESTFRKWVKEENVDTFGMINLNTEENVIIKKPANTVVFYNQHIRIELKDGYNKEELKKIVEVIS